MIIILGPTGVGKTEFAEKFATEKNQINNLVEIVNCDVGQMYEKICIGTAKPDWRNSSVKQHLFDIFTEPRNYSVHEYLSLFNQVKNKLKSEKKIPLIVGGSGFYINSILFPPNILELEKKSTEILKNKNYSWDTLREIDPKRAQEIHPNDQYRINRALDIFYEHGILPSDLKPKLNIEENIEIILLERDREDLFERVKTRTLYMIEAGLVKEVELLPEEWKKFLYQKKMIGYKEALDFINGDIVSEKDLLEKICLSTRQYIKKQNTYFKTCISGICTSSSSFGKFKISVLNLSSNNLVRV